MTTPLRLLLIDDNPDDRALISAELEQDFPTVQIEQICDPDTFAQSLEAGDFDLVVTNYQLGWSDGLNVLRSLRARHPGCPVVMFAEGGSEEVAVEGMKAGLHDYVPKSAAALPRLRAAVRAAYEEVAGSPAGRTSPEVAGSANSTGYQTLLNEIAQTALETTDLNTMLQALADRMGELFGADGCFITLWDEVRQLPIPAAAYGEYREIFTHRVHPRPGERSMTASLMQAGEVLVAEDVDDSPYVGPEVASQFPTKSILGLPLIAGDQKLGAALITFDEPHHFTPAEIAQGERLARQIALAVAKARLVETEHERRLLTETLREVTLILASQTNPAAVLDEILRQVHRLVPFQTAHIVLLEGNTLRTARWHGYKDVGIEDFISNLVQHLDKLPLDAEVIRSRTPKVFPDVRQEPQWATHPETGWIRSHLTVPICLGERVLGLLRLDSQTPGKFSTKDAERLAPVANAAAIALENTRLIQSEREQRQLAEALRDVGIALSSSLDFETILDRLLEEISRVVPYDSANIMLIEGTRTRVARTRGYDKFGDAVQAEATGLSLEIATTANLNWMAKHGKPLVIPDTTAYEGWVSGKAQGFVRSWAGAPIMVQGEVNAFFSLDKVEPGYYRPEHAELLAAFAGQAGIAIENARLFAAAEQRAAELEAVRQASLSLTASLELPAVLEAILKSTLGLLTEAQNAHIFLYEGGHLTFGAALWADGSRTPVLYEPRLHGLTYTVATKGQPIAVSNMRDHRLYQDTPSEWEGAIVGLPLKIGQRVVGVMNISYPRPRLFPEAELHVLYLLADQAAIAIENAQLFDKTRRQAEQLEALRQVSQDLTVLRDLDALLYQITERALQLLGRQAGGIFLYRPERDLLEWRVVVGEELAPPGFTLARGEGLSGKIWESGQPMYVNNYTKWPGKSPKRPDLAVAIIGAPIQWGDEFLGVLVIADTALRPFSTADTRPLMQFATQVAIAVQNARLYDQVQRHAAELEERVTERTLEVQVLYELSQEIGYTLNHDELFRLTLTHLQRIIPFDVGGVCLLSTDHCELYLLPTQPLTARGQAAVEQYLATAIDELPEFLVDRSQIATKIIEPETQNTGPPTLDSFEFFFQVSLVAESQTVGMLLLGFRSKDQFTENRIRLAYTVAGLLSQAMQRLRSLLAAEQQRLQNMVAHLPTGVLLLDADHRLLLANPAGREALSHLGPANELQTLTHLGREPLEAILARHNEPLPVEITINGPPRRIYEVQARPVESTEIQWVLTAREVTHEHEVQQQLHMQERLATVGQLAAGIAHDFNNILTSIMGFATLVRLEPSISDAARHDLDRIIEQGQRAAQLIRQILDFSRQSITEKRALELLPLLKETCKLLERTIPEDVRLVVEAEPGEYLIDADPVQLQQVLTNLALNARDAMPSGGTLHFRLSWFVLKPGDAAPSPDMPPGKWLVLTVTDEGSGIRSEVLPRIFEPFFTTKDVGQGTGLGLAQVYGIIKQHGGFIDVDSQLDKGTTFTIYLPPLLATRLPSAAAVEVTAPMGHGETLLVVEDETAVRQVLQNMLERLNYTVLTAINGQEALAIYEREGPDIALVLTDVTMPEMGGITLAQTLRRRNPAVKVIALTGYPLESEDQELLAQGIVDWLQKPLNLEQLAQTVRQALQT